MGLDKTYLVGQKEISTHGKLDTTHSRLDKLTGDWTMCPADGTNCLEDRTKHSSIQYFIKPYNASKLVLKCSVYFLVFAVFCQILNKFLTYALCRTFAGWKTSGFGQKILEPCTQVYKYKSTQIGKLTKEQIHKYQHLQ